MNRYSIFSLVRNGLFYHQGWEKAWRSPAPRAEYDAVIVGGGGHGLATAYYLAREHGMRNIAVACGFQSPPHFSKCYRSYFSYPPGQERHRIGAAGQAAPAGAAVA